MEEERIIEEIVKKKEKKKRKSIKEIFKGFTLVELLAVIVILAIIMIIAIPSVLSTMESAKRSTFGEYVTKVYNLANDKYLSDEMLLGSPEYVRYDITKDLGLSATGSFKGYAVILKRDGKTEVYIGMTDGEYYTATQLGDDESTIVPYINYTLAGEPKYTNELTKYDGKTNYFVRGTYNSKTVEDIQNEEYNLPEASNSSSLTPIEEVLTPEAQFQKDTKDFFNAAVKMYKDNTPGLIQTNVIESEWNTTTTALAIIPYSAIYPGKTNKGYVFLNKVYTKAKVPVEEGYVSELTQYLQLVAYKDDNYHTIFAPTSTNNGLSATTPFNMAASLKDFTYHTPALISSVKATDMDSLFAKLPSELKIAEIDSVNNTANDFINSNTFFISNSVNDGLTDTDYTVEALMSKYMPLINSLTDY